ncbi:YlcI/YnfO family protein [Agathobacter sp.]|uniref:YlcI/YnfO family protein n=1 Tax=Agathobacter sp. TaxID=2021311 RepID=UPI00280C2247|nr:YlcI/YnfO family protein [Agathobacter sp.]
MAFQLKSDKKETENKTIRFPLPLIERINEAIENQEVSFSGFVIQACEYALEHLDSGNDSKTNQ